MGRSHTEALSLDVAEFISFTTQARLARFEIYSYFSVY